MECPDICSILCCCCYTDGECCGCLNQDERAHLKYPNIEYYHPYEANKTAEMPQHVYHQVPLQKIFAFPQVEGRDDHTYPQFSRSGNLVVTNQPQMDTAFDPMYVTSKGVSYAISQLPVSPARSPASSRSATPEPFLFRKSRTATPELFPLVESRTATPEHFTFPTTSTSRHSLTPPPGSASARSRDSPTSAISRESSAPTSESEEFSEGQQIQFALYHDVHRHTLTIHLQQAINLALKRVYKSVGTSISLFLLPSREEIHRSDVLAGANPYYNQVFRFSGILSEEVRQQVLVLQVYSHDKLSKETLIGTVLTPLNEVELYGMEITKGIGLGQDLLKKHVSGDLLLSLTYISERQNLHGIVLKATNLPKPHKWGLADPYVKIYLTYQDTRIMKWKSMVKKHTLSPVFNEAFEFDISGLNHKDMRLEIFIMDHEKFRHNDTIGIVYIGSKVPTESGAAHFNDVMTSPGQPMSYWHHLITHQQDRKRKRHKSQTL